MISSFRRSQAIAKVYLIDVGENVTRRASKLFDLPDNFKSFDPLLCKLHVINLVPFDYEDYWASDHKEKVNKMLEEFTSERNTSFMCKVQMGIQDILFTDTFDVKNEIDGLFKLRFKSKALKEQICMVDKTAGDRLRRLALEGNAIPPPPLETKESPSKAFQPATPTEEFSDIVEESWKNLVWTARYDIDLRHFKHPESFLAVQDVTNKQLVKKNLHDIGSTDVAVPLNKIEVGAVCAIKASETYRAKILSVSDDDVEVLLLDQGQIAKYQKSDLFELPAEPSMKTMFQTIHCRMVGIKPKFNMRTWPPKQISAIHQLLQSYDKLQIHVLKKSDVRDELTEIGMNSFDVILIDPRTNIHLDEVILSQNFADRASVDKPVMAAGIKSRLDSGLGPEASDDNDLKILEELFKEKLKEKFLADTSSELASEDSKTQDEALLDVELKIVEPKTPPPTISTLKFIHKQPTIEWREDDSLVYLLIAASDCIDYGLDIRDRSIDITIKFPSLYEISDIVFYSEVITELCSHELRGRNIIVRLAKKIEGLKWERLTDEDEKSQFIKFSTEKIPRELSENRPETPTLGAHPQMT